MRQPSEHLFCDFIELRSGPKRAQQCLCTRQIHRSRIGLSRQRREAKSDLRLKSFRPTAQLRVVEPRCLGTKEALRVSAAIEGLNKEFEAIENRPEICVAESK